MIKRSPKLLANEEKATTTIQSTSYFVRFVKYMNYSSLIVFISLSIYLIMFSNRLCWLQRHCSFVTERAIPIPNQVQSPFCIAALLSEVHRTRCKIVGRLPYEGDTTLLPSHFITDQWRLFLLTHAGHHLLCSTYYTYDSNRLLMTAIAESWSQTDERTPYPPHPPKEHTITLSLINPTMWALRHWTLNWLSELSQARKKAKTPKLGSPREHSMNGRRSWDDFYHTVMDDTENDNWWWYGGPSQVEITWHGCR